MKGFVKEMSFKSGVKGRGSDRWWERRWSQIVLLLQKKFSHGSWSKQNCGFPHFSANAIWIAENFRQITCRIIEHLYSAIYPLAILRNPHFTGRLSDKFIVGGLLWLFWYSAVVYFRNMVIVYYFGICL